MKKTYIQPEIETAVMPKGALMDGELILAGSSTMGTVGGGSGSGAPRRRDQVF